jgi:hypothetical protein
VIDLALREGSRSDRISEIGYVLFLLGSGVGIMATLSTVAHNLYLCVVPHVETGGHQRPSDESVSAVPVRTGADPSRE